MKIILCFILFIFLVGCQTDSSKQSDVSNKDSENINLSKEKQEESSIRKIDFRNFTYLWTEKIRGEGKHFTLKDGEFEAKEDGLIKLKSIVYDDSIRDQAIITIWVEEGNATSEILYIYAWENLEPKLLQSFEFPAGENISLATAFVAHGELIIETFNQITGDAECCPSVVEISYYKWQEDRFVIQGKPQKISNGYVERLEKSKS